MVALGGLFLLSLSPHLHRAKEKLVVRGVILNVVKNLLRDNTQWTMSLVGFEEILR